MLIYSNLGLSKAKLEDFFKIGHFKVPKLTPNTPWALRVKNPRSIYPHVVDLIDFRVYRGNAEFSQYILGVVIEEYYATENRFYGFNLSKLKLIQPN